MDDITLQDLTLSPRDMLCLGGLPGLRTLRLLRCVVLPGASLLALATLSPQLACLKLQTVQGVLPAVVDDLLAQLTRLTALEVRAASPTGC